MATLHLVNKPGQPFLLCQRALAPGDGLLLIEEGVYLLLAEAEAINALSSSVFCYYLASDGQARGILPVAEQPVTAVDYPQFVQLTQDHDRVVSWF